MHNCGLKKLIVTIISRTMLRQVPIDAQFHTRSTGPTKSGMRRFLVKLLLVENSEY
jgi:hypothetical protein